MSKKSANRKFLVTQLKRFDYGKEQMNRVIAPISFILSIFTLMKVYGVSFTTGQIFLASLVAIFTIFFAGILWDKMGLVEEEIEYTNERNRFVKAMLKNSWLKKLNTSKINDD